MFSYCKWPERSHNLWNSKYSNKVAGNIHKKGTKVYNRISIFNKRYATHRIIWLYMTGVWPEYGIDHEDGDGLNNKWDNLRDVSQQENTKNQKLSSKNSSGFTGVYWKRLKGKYEVQIGVNNKLIWLGSFTIYEDAVAARIAANIKYGFHPNHGKRGD